MSKDKTTETNYAPFPADGFVRAYQIIGDADKGIAPFFPVSRSQWFAGIKQGIYPQGIKLSKRVTVWRAKAIREMVNNLSNSEVVK